MRAPGLGLLTLLVLAGPALALELPAQDRAALETRVETFDTAIRANDTDQIVDVVPPKVLAFIADKAGVPLDKLKEGLATQIEQAMADVTIVSFGMDLDTAEVGESATGRTYLLVPTHTVMQAETVGKVETKTHTLAFADGGKWYLVRLDNEQQKAILKEAYPEFADITFPEGTIEIVEKK
ncbi:hypothetical protein AB7M35_004178 [Amorphus suaedae]